MESAPNPQHTALKRRPHIFIFQVRAVEALEALEALGPEALEALGPGGPGGPGGCRLWRPAGGPSSSCEKTIFSRWELRVALNQKAQFSMASWATSTKLEVGWRHRRMDTQPCAGRRPKP